MKDRYASNSILLLALNKINCYFQSRLHLNVKLCRKSNTSLPVTDSHGGPNTLTVMNPPDVYHQYEESDTSLPVT